MKKIATGTTEMRRVLLALVIVWSVQPMPRCQRVRVTPAMHAPAGAVYLVLCAGISARP